MCLDLVNISHKLKKLSSSEHSVINVLAHRANKDTHECWPSIKSLCESTSLNEKTVQSALLSLIAKGLIFNTGKKTGSTKRVIVYKLNINTPKIGGVQNLNTPNFSDNTPNLGGVKYPQNRGLEREVLKGKRKEGFSISSGPKNLKDIYQILKLP
jgi:DNA-binding transcriptional MocR family regulator